MKFEGNHELPSLEFDEATGQMKIWGRSIAIEHKDFWQPLLTKMIVYIEYPRDIHLELALEYFNSPSAVALLKLLNLIDMRVGETKRNFVITWDDLGDEDMREAGEDFESMLKNTTWKFK